MTPDQDLVFFQDHTLVSKNLLENDSHNIAVVSHTQSNKPTWLLSAVVEECLVGASSLVNKDAPKKSNERALITYVSFTQDEANFHKRCRKYGLPLNITFVDCFSTLFTDVDPQRPETAIGVFKRISQAIGQLLPQIVIVENPEVLLVATKLTSMDFLKLLKDVARCCNVLFVSIDTDPLLLADEKVTDAYTKLQHVSCLNVQLQPLPTGRAVDVTGCLTVSRGSVPVEGVLPREYTYHVSTETSIKFYYR